MTDNDNQERIVITIPEIKPFESFVFNTGIGDTWLLKVYHNGTIVFNKEMFPNSTADDFAKAFIEIIENSLLSGKND